MARWSRSRCLPGNELAFWSGRPSVCHPKRRRLIVAFALVLAGCGASAKPHHAAPPQPSQADRMKAVVRAWTANLNAGNNAAEARLFSLPAVISLMEGPYGCWCLTPAEVVQFHAQLLCSGKIVSIKVRGRYATAVFRLGDRETSKCDSPAQHRYPLPPGRRSVTGSTEAATANSTAPCT